MLTHTFYPLHYSLVSLPQIIGKLLYKILGMREAYPVLVSHHDTKMHLCSIRVTPRAKLTGMV